ncbi:GAF domain-containing protein [Crocosphaera sp. Alani8]|uniref:GAF domain-containing protein n=1 Tax=Crocosphaera sp. Alani8 TaxID=3038952 RepID=UPI00313B23BB
MSTPPVPQSFALKQILRTTVNGIGQFLQADRVLIAQVMESGEIVVIEEYKQGPWKTLLNHHIGQFVTPMDLEAWELGSVVTQTEVQEESKQSFRMMKFDRLYDVKAKIIVPIRQNENQAKCIYPVTHSNHQTKTDKSLWGLIIVHQCSSPHQWTSSELGFLSL